MSGLILKLGPHERVLVNGAVIQNGDRRVRLSVVTPNAHILRLKDAIHPNEANTPVRRICYIAQLILTGDADQDEGNQQLLQGIEQLYHALTDHHSRNLLRTATAAIMHNQHYQALKTLRHLLPYEDRLLAAKYS